LGKPKAKPRELKLKVDNIIPLWRFVVPNKMYRGRRAKAAGHLMIELAKCQDYVLYEEEGRVCV